MTATVRLKHLCSRWGEYGLGVPAEDYTPEGIRLIRTSDITDDGRLTPAEEGVFVHPTVVDGLELRTGDVLISRSGTVGRSLIFDEERHGRGTFAAYLVRFRLKDQFDPRFTYYFTKSAPFEQQIRLEATQATIANFNAQKLGNLQLPDFSAERQAAIANSLDRETTRIDELISRKRRMVLLIEERARGIADSVIWADVGSEIPLMRAVDALRPVMYGIVLPGPDVPEGVPIVKGGDVSAHRLTPHQLCRTTQEIEAPYARARLRAGDVLFAIRGGVGDAALVPPELEGGNITQDVARIAPAHEFRSDWLLEVMRTQTVQRRASQLITGATIRGLNIRDLERIGIPWSTSERQEADIASLRPFLVACERLGDSLRRQIGLLAEHRQALITAAVTGKIDVTAEAV